MKNGVSTWDDIRSLPGDLLIIVNSKSAAVETVDRLFTLAAERASSRTRYVIAPSKWRDWLTARGVAGEHVLWSVDDEGRDIELNHFLESPQAILWTSERPFSFVIGTEPHNLYNEEIKDVFERRVALLLGQRLFLAHTLPAPYVFTFNLAGLLERCTRNDKVAAFSRLSRETVDDLYRQWLRSSKPAADAGPSFGDLASVLDARFGFSSAAAEDEEKAVSVNHEDVARTLSEIVMHLQEVLVDHDKRLEHMTALHRERSEAVEVRERRIAELHAERVEAVQIRDDIIAKLHEQLVPWHRKLLRRLKKGRS